MSRIFLSHSSRDNRQAAALKRWLAQQRPELANPRYRPRVGVAAGGQVEGAVV
jgi:hypothetical protein